MADEFNFKAFQREIEAWAERTSPDARSAFASQCAARVLPNIGGSTRPKDHTGFSFDLTLLRAILTSAVTGTIPTADVQTAARSAAFFAANFAARSAANFAALSARSAANSAHSAARSAARSAAFSAARSAAHSAAHSAALSAAKTLDLSSPKSLFEEPLWLDVTWPDGIANNWKTLRTEWSTDPAMAFWINWYDGLLGGRTPDWALWHDIVLIKDEHWDAGPEAVAREIERIQRSIKTRVAPPVVFDKDKKTFHIGDDIDLPEETWHFVKQRTNMALSNALSANSGNGLTETSYETQAIRAANDAPNATGSILATAYYDASLSLSQHIGDRYPDDPSLINLKNALFAASEEICAHDEVARSRCYRLSQLALPKQLGISDKGDAEEVAEELVKYSDDALAEILRSDASMIKNMQRAPKWVMARFSNYTTTMAIWIDKAQKGDKRVAWLIKKIDGLRDWWPDE